MAALFANEPYKGRMLIWVKVIIIMFTSYINWHDQNAWVHRLIGIVVLSIRHNFTNSERNVLKLADSEIKGFLCTLTSIVFY